MKMAPQAVLFDSDGTLVDSERVFFEATRDVLSSAGIRLRAEQWARWYLADGKSTAEVLDNLGVPKREADTLRERRNELFYQRIEAGVPLQPHVMEMLEWLKPRARLAVVTSASREHFERVHRCLGLKRFFDVIITSDECSVPKPEPDAYMMVLERLGLNAADCLAVEDTPRGARAARAAGLPCVIVPTMLTDRTRCPPDCEIISHIGELTAWFEPRRGVNVR